jgi:hypothetical protein
MEFILVKLNQIESLNRFAAESTFDENLTSEIFYDTKIRIGIRRIRKKIKETRYCWQNNYLKIKYNDFATKMRVKPYLILFPDKGLLFA